MEEDDNDDVVMSNDLSAATEPAASPTAEASVTTAPQQPSEESNAAIGSAGNGGSGNDVSMGNTDPVDQDSGMEDAPTTPQGLSNTGGGLATQPNHITAYSQPATSQRPTSSAPLTTMDEAPPRAPVNDGTEARAHRDFYGRRCAGFHLNVQGSPLGLLSIRLG
jgi:hypothetical protein